jgi:hypothetical protein
MQEGLASKVTYEEGTGTTLASKGPSAQATFVVPVEGHPHMLHINKRFARRAAHHLNGVLVTQEVTTFNGIVGVVFPFVAPVCQRCIDATLGGVGVTPNGMDFTDNSGIGAISPGGDGSPHSRQPSPDYQYIMLQHFILLFLSSLPHKNATSLSQQMAD